MVAGSGRERLSYGLCPKQGGQLSAGGDSATARLLRHEDAERKHNKSRVARMATRLCYVGEPAWLTPEARDSQTD